MADSRNFDRVEYVQPQAGDLTTGIHTAVALNASAALRTVTLDMESWNYAVFNVVFTRNAATDVQLLVTHRHPHGGTNDFQLPVMDVSTAEVTYGFPEHRYTTSASGKFTLVVPVPPGTKRIDAVFSGTSAGGSDTIQVYVTKVAA